MLGTKRVAGREGCPCQEPVPTASPGGTLLGLLPGGGEFQLPAASHAGAWLLLELGARGVGDLVSDHPSPGGCTFVVREGGQMHRWASLAGVDWHLPYPTNTCAPTEAGVPPKPHPQPGFALKLDNPTDHDSIPGLGLGRQHFLSATFLWALGWRLC